MKTLAILFAVSVINGHFETRPFSGDLGAQIRSTAPAWFGYEVKSTRTGEHDFNCDGHHGSNPAMLEGSQAVAVLFRVSNNAIEKVRVHSIECQLDAGGLPFIWIDNVPPGASLAFLEKQSPVFDGAVAAIAQHADPQADALLGRLARSGASEK